jgi:hypothetical protein
MVMSGFGLLPGEIPAGQDFTRFDRRLVESVDPQQMRRQHGFQHEMHHQRAERAFVEPFDIDSADRPARLGQGLGDGALLRRDEVAGGVPREIIRAGELGEVGR